MSKLTIKSRSITEANDYANFGEAYRDFVKRCYTGQKPNYSEKAINFMLDCAHIANGTPGNGLTQQGFKLTKANNVDMIGDCLHLCYENADRSKSVDVWLNPHSHTAMLDLYGFNPERPHSSMHKEFTSDKHTADDFYEFIKSLSDYKGESKMKTCSMQKKKESLAKMQEFTKNDDSVFDYIMKSTAHNALVETIGEICTLALDATLDDNPQVGPDTVKTIENNAKMAYKEYQSVIEEIIVRIAKQFTYQKSGR